MKFLIDMCFIEIATEIAEVPTTYAMAFKNNLAN